MKRRSFLAALFGAPAIAKAIAADAAQLPKSKEAQIPFVIDDDVLRIDLAKVNTPVSYGLRRSANGRMVIDHAKGCITLT